MITKLNPCKTCGHDRVKHNKFTDICQAYTCKRDGKCDRFLDHNIILALVTSGKHKSKECEVQQWCNDWFSVEVDGESLILDPRHIAFTPMMMDYIIGHKNNGTLFQEFETSIYTKEGQGPYIITFKR